RAHRGLAGWASGIGVRAVRGAWTGRSPPGWLGFGGAGEPGSILAVRDLGKQTAVISSRSLYTCRYRCSARVIMARKHLQEPQHAKVRKPTAKTVLHLRSRISTSTATQKE